MEYYHYVNIFETKGLEYILVICFLITLVLFVRNLERPPKWQRRSLEPPTHPGSPVVVVNHDGSRESTPVRPPRNGRDGDPAGPGTA